RDRDPFELRIGQMELDDRSRVVVEATDERRHHAERDAERREPVLERAEVRAVLVAQQIEDLRRTLDDSTVLRFLRVEDAQHVRVDAALRSRRELLAERREVRGERLAHLRSTFRIADRVDTDLIAVEADLGEKAMREPHDLAIDGGLLSAEALEVPLPELAEAQLLRTLPAEHRLVREEPLRTRRLVQAGFEERARDRRSRFGPQHQIALAAERHVEHLFADDVRRLAGRL